MMEQDFNDVTDYMLITENQVPFARDAGLRIHHEVEYDEQGRLTRDDWYCADWDWVSNYHNNGGIWGYAD